MYVLMIQHRHVILISPLLPELFSEKNILYISICITLVLIMQCALYDYQVKVCW